MGPALHPTLNATLNAMSIVLLSAGYVSIKRGRPEVHKRFMLTALMTSILFLTSYLVYHARVGSVPYPHHDWTRSFYFAILIPHIVLAAAMAPCVLITVGLALKQKYLQHKKVARWVWPLWMFVSLSGVLVYLMLYKF
jgi:uncharacterized membrane protein YozB (DUF420 family)